MREQLRAIQTALEYIEGHLREAITVADMAAAAGYSLYHFIRTFNQSVHHTPYDYLMRRRLSEAARDLLTLDSRIIDIAFDYQFNNHETFSRAFKRMFDTQPSQWRERGFIPRRSLMPALTLAHLEQIAAGDYLHPVLVEWEAIHLAGLMTQGRGSLPQLWASLGQALIGIPLKSEICSYFGITSHPQSPVGTSFFLGAVEIASPERTPPTLVSQTLPAGSYARFIHCGPDENLPLTLDYIYHTWLPKSDYWMTYPIEIECFGAGIDSERAIYIPIENLC
jgi:AraC family transcriptional regulator